MNTSAVSSTWRLYADASILVDVVIDCKGGHTRHIGTGNNPRLTKAGKNVAALRFFFLDHSLDVCCAHRVVSQTNA